MRVRENRTESLGRMAGQKKLNIVTLHKPPSRTRLGAAGNAEICGKRLEPIACAAEVPGAGQPRPLVLVRLAAAFFSINSMILPATSLPVAVSMPLSPGEELTSRIRGP